MTLRRRFFAICLTSLPLASLVSCGYTVETSNQDVMFVTPGADYAECDVYIEKLRYRVNPPQKINIMKSEQDMEIKCIAPGNRSKELVVPSGFEARTIIGTPAGMAWDYASESMFSYPSVIAIDFSQEKNVANPVPRHNSDDVVQPEDYDLEEYLAGVPRLNSDRHKKQEIIRRREDVIKEISEIQDTPINEPKTYDSEKGSLNKVIQNLEIEKQSKSSTQTQSTFSSYTNAQSTTDSKKTSQTTNTSKVPSVNVTPLPNDAPALEDSSLTGVEPQAGSAAPVKLYPGE